MKNILMEQLYDMSKETDENGLDSFSESKLRRELKKGADKNFMKPNKKTFEENERRFRSCNRYNPCPICEKCKNKASHLYISCQVCQIPICIHNYSTMKKMIIRDNFIIKPSKAVKTHIKRLEEEYVHKKHMEKLY